MELVDQLEQELELALGVELALDDVESPQLEHDAPLELEPGQALAEELELVVQQFSQLDKEHELVVQLALEHLGEQSAPQDMVVERALAPPLVEVGELALIAEQFVPLGKVGELFG